MVLWPTAHSRWICDSVSGVDYVSVLPGDLNSPGVLVYSSAEGGEGFVQYWLDWPYQTVRQLYSWLLTN